MGRAILGVSLNKRISFKINESDRKPRFSTYLVELPTCTESRLTMSVEKQFFSANQSLANAV